MFSSFQMMEQYLKRIANEPNASPTTPLSSTSPGRSSKGIYPDSKRIIREQATGSERSKPASKPGAPVGGKNGSSFNVLKDVMNTLKDANAINPLKLVVLSKSMNPLAESIRKFADTIGDIDSKKAENVGKISGVGNLIKGITEIDKIDGHKTSSNLKFLAGGVKNFLDTILSIDKRKADKAKPLSFVGDIMSGLSGILKISTGQAVAVKVFLPMLGNAIKKFADNISQINAKKAGEGMKLLPKMGLSLLAFTGSIALSAVAITAVALDPIKFLLLFTIMGASAIAMNTIGGYSKNINKGSIAIAGMGLGMLAFVGSMALSAAIMPPIDKLLTVPLAIAAMGGVFYLAGTMWDKIALGALAMGAAGLATWLISKPIETIAGVLGQNPAAIWQIPLMITGIGAAFALAGLGPVPLAIAAGSLALGVAGGALWVLSKGLSNMLSLPTITKEKAEGIELGIRSVVTGFGRSFQDLSLKESLTLPLKIPMVGLMGLTLFGLAAGIANYQNKAGTFGPKDSENLKGTISGLSEAFATAGSTVGMSKLFGFNVGRNDVERGIDSTMRMGRNLSQLADGVMAWKKMPITPADVQMVSDNVQRVLNVIPGIFAGIGRVDNGTTGKVNFLGLSFENPFSKGDTEQGIASTMKMGENLKNLSEGIMSWKDGGKAGFNSADLPGITKNIQNILATIPGSFAELGKKDRQTSGIFPWSDGDIENGIELAEDLGPSLTAITNLLDSVKTGNLNKATNEISKNIPILLKSYASSLNDFGKTLKGDPEDTLDQISNIIETFVKVSDSTNKINSQFAKLGDLADPLDKVAKSMLNINSALKAHLDLLGKQNQVKLDSSIKYFSAISDVAKSNTAVLKQNMDAVVKSGFGSAAMNSALAAQQVSVTNQINQQQPQVKVNIPKADMSASDKINVQILEALKNIAQLLAQSNATNSQQSKALDDLSHMINSGIKIKDSNGLG